MSVLYNALTVLCPVAVLAVALRTYRRRVDADRRLRSCFAGKVVWVTGASSGIGRALAIAFAARGAKLILSARREVELATVAGECAAAASQATGSTVVPSQVAKVFPFDLTEAPGALVTRGSAAAKLWDRRVDVLVNNGGVSSRSAAEDTAIDVDAKVMAIDYLAPVALTKGVLPGMLAAKAGSVVVISSVQGRLAVPFRTSYAAAKHALHGYFESLRAEVADRGVSVLLVCPGYVATSLSLNAVTGTGSTHGVMDAATARGMKPEALAAEVLRALARGDHEVLACDAVTSLAVYARALLPGPLAAYMRHRAAQGWKELRKGH